MITLIAVLFTRQVLENKEQVENLIRKYIKIIRLDCTDEVLKKKMIRKLCDLRHRQCELIEEAEVNSVSGHHFKLETTTTNYCDICMKKQNSLFIPLLNNLNAQLNVCTYCGYSMHVECQSEVRMIPGIRFRATFRKPLQSSCARAIASKHVVWLSVRLPSWQ